METTTTRRFRSTGERIDGASSHIFTAEFVQDSGHIITREHTWSDRFGPVLGSHFTEYRCSCGADFGIGERPHSSHLDALHRDRTGEAERLARILATLERTR